MDIVNVADQFANLFLDGDADVCCLLQFISKEPSYQRAEITSINGNVLQLNVTWTFGGASSNPPIFLKYAQRDYPVMPFYNAFGLPTPPFEMVISH